MPPGEETGYRRSNRGHLEHERVAQLSQPRHLQRRLPANPVDSPTHPVSDPLPQTSLHQSSPFHDLNRLGERPDAARSPCSSNTHGPDGHCNVGTPRSIPPVHEAHREPGDERIAGAGRVEG